jgi:hypothetical protein
MRILERKRLIRIVGIDGVHQAVVGISDFSSLQPINSVDGKKKFAH